jgi:hypothetical protein
MQRTFILRNDNFAQALWAFLRVNWKAFAEQGRPLAVTIAEHKAKRNAEQNKKLHAMLNEIAEQAWVDGRQYDSETWKEYYRRLLIGSEEITLPDGAVMERGISTTTLSVGECADFITQMQEDAQSRLGVEFSQ